MCNGRFLKHGNKTALLSDVIVDLKKYSGANSGEDLQNVIGQKEQVEYYRYSPGFMEISCDKYHPSNQFLFQFKESNHLNSYWEALNFKLNNFNPHHLKPIKLFENKVVLFVTRYEYANFYHTTTEWYTVFVILHLFKLQLSQTVIILTDGHPYSTLDEIWTHLYPNTYRLSKFGHSRQLFIEKLIWVPFGYMAPMFQFEWEYSPFMNEFRSFVLKRYNLPDNLIVKCSHIQILFVWRHDYVAHPRNPSGKVSRKIGNEKAIYNALSQAIINDDFLSQFHITLNQTQLDSLSMLDQLKLTTSTSILIGMHGAGLTHTMFLPGNACLIELFPSYYSNTNIHFQKIAKWRNLQYRQLVNRIKQDNNIPNKTTNFDPKHIIKQVKDAIMHFDCEV